MAKLTEPPSGPPQADRRKAENSGKDGYAQREKRYWVRYRPLPKGFAIFTFGLAGSVFAAGLIWVYWRDRHLLGGKKTQHKD
jgi:hypothetical protein